MKSDLNKLRAYITGEFNHFSKVSGYPVRLDLEFRRQSENCSRITTCVNVSIDGFDLYSSIGKKHSLRLFHLCERIQRKRPNVYIDVAELPRDTQPEKSLSPEDQSVVNAATHNRHMIEKSKLCGCYSCESIYEAVKVTPDCFSEDGTAICPLCGIDSVIGDASGIPLTKENLASLHKRWFGGF